MIDLIRKNIPAHWIVEAGRAQEFIIQCADVGAVTIDEKMRNFAPGCTWVRTRGNFKGRGWQIELIKAAVAALQESEEWWKQKRAESMKREAQAKGAL